MFQDAPTHPPSRPGARIAPHCPPSRTNPCVPRDRATTRSSHRSPRRDSACAAPPRAYVRCNRRKESPPARSPPRRLPPPTPRPAHCAAASPPTAPNRVFPHERPAGCPPSRSAPTPSKTIWRNRPHYARERPLPQMKPARRQRRPSATVSARLRPSALRPPPRSPPRRRHPATAFRRHSS